VMRSLTLRSGSGATNSSLLRLTVRASHSLTLGCFGLAIHHLSIMKPRITSASSTAYFRAVVALTASEAAPQPRDE
jgi:hypothetical protein